MPRIVHITTIDKSLRYLLLNQMLSIQQAGYDVYGISAPGTEVPDIEEVGIRHIAVPMSRRLSPLADLVSLWRLIRILRREQFTLVHTHNPKPGLLGQLAARIAGTPIVVNTVHGFYFHDGSNPLWRKFLIVSEKIAALCSDVILSQNSEDIQTAIVEGICSPNKIKYLGNGINLDQFERAQISEEELARKREELNIDPSKPVVGFVGRLVKEKGILEFLQAAKLVLNAIPGVQFLIVGPLDTAKPDAVTSFSAKKYEVEDSCIFTGMRQDMPEMYALMNVFALPSHREGFPRSPMEASAMSVPCVVSDIRGCREAVVHGRNGLLVPVGNVNVLAEAIIALVKDQELATKMGEAGHQMAKESFNEQLVFDKVKTEYARLFREKGLPSAERSHSLSAQL